MRRALLGVALGLAACGGSSSPVPKSAANDTPPALRSIARLRGTVIVHPDSTLTFAACGTTTERPVVAPPSSQLTLAITAVNGALRDSIFADFTADTSAQRVQVRDTHFASMFGEGSPCDRPSMRFDWEALGNEPFWHVTIDGTQVVLERPEPPRELVFDAEPTMRSGNLTTIIAHRTLGKVHDLKLDILREPCRDGMSDNWYPFRAELRVGDLALHGCARQ